MVNVPELAMDLLEQISFEARNSEYVDAKSGVSARMSITAFENLLSTAERRVLISGASDTTIRLSDFMGVIPAITGKIELVYEGEQEGANFVVETLIEEAIKSLFQDIFPKINKLERKDAQTPYDDVISWFFDQEGFELFDEDSDKVYKEKLDTISPLTKLIDKHHPNLNKLDSYFVKEMLLWGLVAHKKLSKYRFSNGVRFKDMYGSYINEL